MFAMLGLAALVCALASTAHAATALILDPPPGFKLAEEQRRGVEVRIAIGDPAAEWRLTVAPLSGDEVEDVLAEGTGDFDGMAGEVSAVGLRKADPYELRLYSALGVHRIRFMVPDHQYVLIPLDPGDFEHARMAGSLIDRSGWILQYGAATPDSVHILHRRTGKTDELGIGGASTVGQALSADGRRFFYRGFHRFQSLGHRRFGIGYVAIDTEESVGVVDSSDTRYLSVDYTGESVAFLTTQGVPPGASLVPLQYFLMRHGELSQLTNFPDAAATDGGPLRCPRSAGSKPLITADGSRVILITRSALGMEGVPEAGRCKVFAYDVESEDMTLLHVFPENEGVDLTTLSDDGRWLSYTVIRVIEGNVRISQGALLDLETGEQIDPIAGVYHQPTFDAVVTGNGEKVVISTTADLDPRVGNADGNMELFLYDRLTGEVAQITDTVGGIGSRPGGCSPYKPAASGNGEVVLSSFMVLSDSICRLDGPQRTVVSAMRLPKFRAVRKRPGNRGPALLPLEPIHVELGRTVELPFAATDADGDPVSLFIQRRGDIRIPDGARVTDRRDGTGQMTWRPRPEQRGRYTFRVAAFDEGGGETYADVDVTVSHSADCNGDGRVTPAELRRCVDAALGAPVPPDCRLCDADGDGSVCIDELLRGVLHRD